MNKILFLLLLIISGTCSAFAQAYEYETRQSGGVNSWSCSTNRDDVKCGDVIFLLGFGGENGKTCSLSLAFYRLQDGRFDDFSSTLEDIDEDAVFTVKLTLSNGEVFTCSKAIKGSLTLFYIGTQNLVSDRKTFSKSSDAAAYAVYQLRRHNISRVELKGKTLNLNNFRSASTIDAMCKTLVAKTGDQGQYGNDMDNSNAPSLTNNSSSAGFSYCGTVRNIEVKSSSPYQDLKNYIGQNGCKNGIVTDDNDYGIILRGRNDAIWMGNTPNDLSQAINRLHNEGEELRDVHITDGCKWFLLFGRNASLRAGCPQAFEEAYLRANSNNENVLSIAFNDNGGWVLLTEQSAWGDVPTIEFLNRAKEHYGSLKSVFISNMGKVACCERGVYYENLPHNVAEALGKVNFFPRFVKFTDSGLYLITDGNGSYNYFM